MKKFSAALLAIVLLVFTACSTNAPKPFSVKLSGNATTGYLWQIGSADEHLKIEELDYTVNEAKEGEVGVGGYSSFTVCPEKNTPAGVYEAEFLYYRVWEEPSTAIKKATVTVTVAEDGTASYAQSDVLDIG